ncbi:MAG: hypothetical protein HYV09_21950 [Deltaproteobacteria bacterium]|nr:hypothetical protein [Deltaproteobacteria bacterium]
MDETFPAPWAPRDEPKLYQLVAAAAEADLPLEVVAGSAPAWSDPWSRARRVWVVREGWNRHLIGDDGSVIASADVQLARLVAPVRH